MLNGSLKKEAKMLGCMAWELRDTPIDGKGIESKWLSQLLPK